MTAKQKQLKKTAQLHINPKLHKKFKLFCIDNNRPMQQVTEYIISRAMKTPAEIV